MMNDIYNFIFDGLNAVLGFFDQIMTSVEGLWLWISSFICMFLVYKILLSPLLGSMSLGSDVAGTGLVRSKHSESSSTSRNRDRSAYYRRRGTRSSYSRSKGNKDK